MAKSVEKPNQLEKHIVSVLMNVYIVIIQNSSRKLTKNVKNPLISQTSLVQAPMLKAIHHHPSWPDMLLTNKRLQRRIKVAKLWIRSFNLGVVSVSVLIG